MRRPATCWCSKRGCRPGYRALEPERLFVSDSDLAVFFGSLAELDLVSGFASDLLVLSFFMDFTGPIHRVLRHKIIVEPGLGPRASGAPAPSAGPRSAGEADCTPSIASRGRKSKAEGRALARDPAELDVSHSSPDQQSRRMGRRIPSRYENNKGNILVRKR